MGGHEYESDLELSDHEAGWVLSRGAIVGVPVTFVLTVLLVLAAGGSFGVALGMAIWPAVVGGPFLGSLAALVRVDQQHHHHPTPA